jgi:hypothetical protein
MAPSLVSCFAEQPDDLGVRHSVLKSPPDEAHEREPVAELVLDLIVRERVERLQHQGPEHMTAEQCRCVLEMVEDRYGSATRRPR